MGGTIDYERYRRAGQQACRNNGAYQRRIAQIRRRRLMLVAGIAAALALLAFVGVRAAVRSIAGKTDDSADLDRVLAAESFDAAEDPETTGGLDAAGFPDAAGVPAVADGEDGISGAAGATGGELYAWESIDGSSAGAESVSALDGYIAPASELPPEGGPFSARSEDASHFVPGYSVQRTSAAQTIPEDWADCNSSYAVLVDLASNTVVAEKNAQEVISPASMTKILTLLTAVDMITDLKDTFTVTIEVTDYCYRNDCSAAGFALDETVTVEDLLYGLILPSGGDAAYALALYCSGSMESFAEAMNAKTRELGLSEHAHFTNSAGLYDDGNHCTVSDMAMILKAAVENELCREVLSRHIYTTSATEQHPEGIELSNWFLRKIEDKDCHGEVACAKTGFVNESGCCAASYQISNSGKRYICVTGNAWSSWRCIYDHVAIYSRYTE